MHPPELATYWDHRRYLADWFDWKKAKNPRFSHRLFARLTGQANPSLLLHVIQGKRNLTERTVEAYIEALSLSDEDAEDFRLLVQFNQASHPDARSRCFEALSAARRFRNAGRIEGGSFRYLSRWYVVATRELALCEGFRADAEWLAGALRPAVTTEQAREALDLLIELGMLEVAEDGTVTVHEQTLVTPHEVEGLAIYNFHRGMIALATSCLDRVPPAERHVGAVTVAVPESSLPELKRELSRLQERVLDLADGASHPDRVMQVTLQLFPLSRALSETEPGSAPCEP